METTGIERDPNGGLRVLFRGKVMASQLDCESAEFVLQCARNAAIAGTPGRLLDTEEALDGCAYCGEAAACLTVRDQADGTHQRACAACAAMYGPVDYAEWLRGQAATLRDRLVALRDAETDVWPAARLQYLAARASTRETRRFLATCDARLAEARRS